jgi:hypothetical protein
LFDGRVMSVEHLTELVNMLVNLLKCCKRLARPFNDLQVGQTPFLLLIPMSKALGKSNKGGDTKLFFVSVLDS